MTETITINKDTDIHSVVDELAYRAYQWNRIRTPQYSPEQWKCVFGKDVDAMERRYQSEVTK